MKAKVKKILSITLIVLLVITIVPLSASASSSESNVKKIGEAVTFDELKNLFPEAKLTSRNMNATMQRDYTKPLIYLTEKPVKVYEKRLANGVIWLNMFSDNSFTYASVTSLNEKNVALRSPSPYIVEYDDFSPVYGYRMAYRVAFTSTSSSMTITNVYFNGGDVTFNVGPTYMHCYRYGHSVSPSQTYSVGTTATTHGHFGLYYTDPISGEYEENGSAVLVADFSSTSSGSVNCNSIDIEIHSDFYYND